MQVDGQAHEVSHKEHGVAAPTVAAGRPCLHCKKPLTGLRPKAGLHPECRLARRRQLVSEANPEKACVVCGQSLRGSDPRRLACKGECAKEIRRHYFKERGRKRRGPRPKCAGLPRVVEPGLLLQAVSCATVLGWGEELRCAKCKGPAEKRRQRKRLARQKGERACPCGAVVSLGDRERRAAKYCRACKTGKGPKEKPEKAASPHEKAAEDFDVLRLLQEGSEHGCATREEWAIRVGRDPKCPLTDRQWSRMKNRLKAHGYEVKNVEFDAVKDTVNGQTQNYRRWGVRVKTANGDHSRRTQEEGSEGGEYGSVGHGEGRAGAPRGLQEHRWRVRSFRRALGVDHGDPGTLRRTHHRDF